ncbi:MAG: family transcriptional regulator [Acidimicrobiaceae bacterium]|nr:family transcriptional regulator [Acidimicrobiaceae bacterium]
MAATTGDLEIQLGKGVRAHRLRQGLTQAELAERANVALGALKALEQGRNSTTATLVKVLRALGQTDWLSRLSPPAPTFSPLDLPKKRNNKAQNSRVRRSQKLST